MASFTSVGKHKKPNLSAKASFGHVQFVQEITYHAIIDSSGSIIKGDIVSDTNYDERMFGGTDDMLRTGKRSNHLLKPGPTMKMATKLKMPNTMQMVNYEQSDLFILSEWRYKGND